MFELVNNGRNHPIIKVIGAGGGGCNAIRRMMTNDMPEVEFYAANTDMQALEGFDIQQVIQLGKELTQGYGAGADPEIGRKAAIESTEHIKEIMQGADMVFIATGMGGGTGTGATPIIAEIAKELNILTVSVVTKPFDREGPKRMKIAEQGIQDLAQFSNSLIVIPNNKLKKVMPKGTKSHQANQEVDKILCDAIKGITDIIFKTGEMNVDFADVCTVMSEKGMAMMGTGTATGEDRAKHAANMAVKSPLLEDTDYSKAKGALINITVAKESLEMEEEDEIYEVVKEMVGEDANVIPGTVYDDSYGDGVKVTVILTGLESNDNGSNHSPPTVNQGKTFHQPNPPKKIVDNDMNRFNVNVPKFLR